MKAQPWRLALAAIAAAVLLVSVALRGLFFFVTVAGPSMEPSLRDGDRVVVYKKAADIHVHDVVAVRTDASMAVKRVVAIAGQTIEIAHGRLLANGREIVLSATGKAALGGLTSVPDGFLVVAGDNGRKSLDSRHYGLISTDALLGRVVGAKRSVQRK